MAANMKCTGSGLDPRQCGSPAEHRRGVALSKHVEKSDLDDVEMLVEEMAVTKKTACGMTQYAGATPGRVKERRLRRQSDAGKKLRTRRRKKMSMYKGMMYISCWTLYWMTCKCNVLVTNTSAGDNECSLCLG